MIFYILSIFLSAFLVFQIQPMIARYILPWFGGTPAVWSTVQMFFQVALTGGYAYAYWLMGRKQQRRLHLAILGISSMALLALALFWPSPITPGAEWKPASVEFPVLRIFLLLAISVGLPYFILATNSPLQQAWFGRAFPGKSPYWLYALSNVGSLLGLLTYPLLIEPWLNLSQQGWFWSIGYLLFAILTAYVAWRSLSSKPAVAVVKECKPAPRPTLFLQTLWIALSATASILLLAVTSQMTQEVAVIPFLWILPLGVYLLSFVFAFSGEGMYSRPVFSVLFSLVSIGLVYLLFNFKVTPLLVQIGLYTLFVFVCCMVAHGELYRLRPDSSHLTRFYLMVSIGGALGGISVNLVAPYIFSGYWELYIGWAMLALLLVVLTFYRHTPLRPRLRFAHDAWVGVVAVMVVIFTGYIIFKLPQGDLYRQRNFYGVLRVKGDETAYTMVHGVTNHGFQLRDPEKSMTPTSYFWRGGGIGLAIRNHPKYGKQPMKVGILGQGTGTIAAYGQPGDTYRFYEINPLVDEVAQGQGGYFSFLADSPANIEVVMGDARISLEQEPPQNYDVLVLDTFSSDSIPVHLLTRESFAIYLQHLAPDGVIAAHISNRYLDLRPVVWLIGREFDLSVITIFVPASPEHPESLPSLWMVLSRDPKYFDAPEIAAVADRMENFQTNIRLWTDDYSNLFQVLK